MYYETKRYTIECEAEGQWVFQCKRGYRLDLDGSDEDPLTTRIEDTLREARYLISSVISHDIKKEEAAARRRAKRAA